MNTNKKIQFIKEFLLGGGAIFLITLLAYYFIAIKYEIVFNASGLPTDFIDLPFYKLAKDLGDLFLLMILLIFSAMFLKMCITRLILTTSLINSKFKRYIEIPSEFILDSTKSQKKSKLIQKINDPTTNVTIKEQLQNELSRRDHLWYSSIFYLITGVAFILIFFNTKIISFLDYVLAKLSFLDYVSSVFIFLEIFSKIFDSLGYVSIYFLVNGIIMSLYGLYVMFAVLHREHSYLLVYEDFFRKITFSILMTMILGILSVLAVILIQYNGETELFILQNDENTLREFPCLPEAKSKYSFDYLVLETNTVTIWRRAEIEIPKDDSPIQINPTDIYIRTSNDEERVYNLKVDQDLDVSDKKIKINFSFENIKKLENSVSNMKTIITD